MRTAIRLLFILRKLRPDILHIHSAKAGLVGRMAVALMRKPPKVILTFHSFVFDERMKPRRRWLVARVERRLQKYADRIVAVSGALRDELVNEMGLDPGGMQVIHNGVVFRDIPKPERTGNRVGTVARLAPQKGLEYFVEAAALVKERVPGARFTIIGDGPLRFWLETRAKQVGVEESIEFLGFRGDALSIVAGWDVFALTSVRETFGMALVEAMSQEVPVVATSVGGIPEIVDGTSTGLLAETGNAEDIAEKIVRLLEDKKLASEIAHAGNEFVRAHFNAERMLSEVDDLYSNIVLERRVVDRKEQLRRAIRALLILPTLVYKLVRWVVRALLILSAFLYKLVRRVRLPVLPRPKIIRRNPKHDADDGPQAADGDLAEDEAEEEGEHPPIALHPSEPEGDQLGDASDEDRHP
jgi:glycosyltransferase involved in cell wall biosynthesis